MLSSPPDHVPRSATKLSQFVNLPRVLRLFLLAIFGFSIASLCFALLARLLGLGLPYSFPGFFNPRSFLADFFEFRVRFYDLGKPSFFHQQAYFMYPPAMVLPMEMFYRTPHPYWGFVFLLVFSGALFTLGFFLILHKRGLAIGSSALLALGVAVTSYPYMHLIERGNTEVFIWIAVTFGVWCFYRGHFSWAAVFLGIATALKIYPFIFFALFLPRRRYREIVLGAVVVFATTLLGLRVLSPDIAYAFAWSSMQLQAFGRYYAAYPWWTGYDHSFFSLLKFASLPWHPDLTPFVRPYTWFIATACLVVYFARLWRLPVVNQILALSILTVSIAPVSYDYTLLSLYPAFAVLCITTLTMDESRQKELVPHYLLFAAILTPESYLVVHGVAFGGQFRAICLLTLLVLALRRPLSPDASVA